MISYQFSNQKILVTGASGFIGTHLCRQLCKEGAEVHAVSRSKLSGDKNSVNWLQGDLSNINIARKIVNFVKPDLIFHLASHVVGARGLEIVLPTFHNNLVSTVNLLTVATEINCRRIILAGSMEEPEGSDINAIPSSPYAAAKWASNAYAQMFQALYETPVTIARIFMVYGPGQKDVKKLIPYVTLSLLNRQPPQLSNGKRPVDWIYVEDVVEGLLAISQSQYREGHVIDLGSGELIPVRAVVERLVNIIDSGAKPLFGQIPERPMEQVRVANIEDTYAKICWRPKTSLENGLQKTVDWYKEQLKKSDKSVFSNNT